MPKTRDIPNELRDFNKMFEDLTYRHDAYVVFDDFLDFFINYFSFNHRIDLERLKRAYTLEERQKFQMLIYETIKVFDKMIVHEKSWYDLFGEFYQVLTSRSKASRFGQFFTPTTICDFSAEILNIQGDGNINEPTCGSGRFNLAVHVRNPKLFHIAQDLDYMCVRMAAINFMLHGINGVVICMDTLSMSTDSFRGAFRVNQLLRYTGIPQIDFINDVGAAYSYLLRRKSKDKGNSIKEEVLVNQKTKQISMF